MKHLGSGHQYTPMVEHVTFMVAIDTGNGQQRGADNDVVPWPIEFSVHGQNDLLAKSSGLIECDSVSISPGDL